MKLAQRLQVGIDISKDRLDFALLAPDGKPIESHRPFANSPAGYRQAKDFLLQVLHAQDFDGLDLAGESTSYYWLPAFVQFFQDPDLAGFDPKLYLLNARWVRWYKQSLSPDHKDDRTDPQYIADRIRTHRPATAWTYEPKWLRLRLLTRFHVHLSKGLTREKNVFQLYLFLAYNLYTHHHPFANPLVQISRSLLRDPELLASLVALPEAELAAQLSELSQGRLPDPAQNAAGLRKAVLESFPLADGLAETVHILLNQILDTIQAFEDRLAAVDAQIQALVSQPEYAEVAWLDSVPGIGPVLAAGLAAEIGGLERFQRVPRWDRRRKDFRPRRLRELEDAIGKLAGLWWPKNSSGRFMAEERRMAKEGNAYLRYDLCLAANCMRLHIPSYSAYYQKKYAEATKHKHNRAVVLTARKALGLFVSLLHHHETYRAKEETGTFAG